MNEEFKIDIVNPEKSFLTKDDVIEAIVPAYEGEMGILKNHISFITFLRPGVINIKEGSNEKIFFVEDGKTDLRIVVSKKNFKLAVTRNKVKRRVKEIFKNNHLFFNRGSFVLIAYKPFAELSFKEASFEIVNAVKSSTHNKVKK